ncbi:hypothetical protein AMS68_006779 [Peltaster fructicola]|uniref:Uncharacterized protein n=1 Tax=Peltaster fructicola TaxID=286661 RepID=A0A6H0Y2L3_9PEZI|nr:hypothetical protein AMS68_006779 [Peltaster fructicola]
MGAAEPPYLYDAPSQRPISYPYSSFEPKRVTKDSWDQATQASRPKSMQSRPLIDLNRHPDSYMIVTGSDLNHKPLPSNTKKWVGVMRWIQFTLRVITELGAMGVLFCVICLKPTDVTQTWVMRIIPGYDMLVTLYGVYHLVRSSRARTPGSSASYHFFALMMDAGLIPFYAFIAVFAYNNLALRKNNADDTTDLWTSFFTSTTVTVDIIQGAFFAACALAGLHLFSLALDLYLVIIFRKIAQLPPDMNPLEDNLTSRKASKHKYKSSELSLSSTAEEKKAGFYNSSNLGSGQINQSRMSVADNKEPEVRQIAFGHSRAGSDQSFSPHNPDSARLSKKQYDQAMYQQLSAQNSSISVGRQSFMTANSRAASPVKDKKQFISDNWYVLDEEPDDIGMSPLRNTPTRSPRLPDVRTSDHDSSFSHQPLAMNPPTPSPEKQQHQRAALEEVSINRSLTVTSDNTVTSSVYSESAPSLKSNKVRTPKSKYYGDLAAATRGVRGYAQVPQHEISPTRQQASPGKQGRVVSRTGADIADESMQFIPEKTSRRRMVSGKAAEEGVAGYWY